MAEKTWAFDAGLGIGHAPSLTGPGLNLEAAYGITDRLEVGLRTGLRFGDEAKATSADIYARTFDPDTYNTGFDTLANPEARIRYAIVGERVVEIGLEGRAYLPFATGTRFGALFGLPVLFHFGNSVRLDTGLLVPVLFYDRTATVISIPARLWFQATPELWLGPISGIRIFNPGSDTRVLLGFGLGYQLSSAVDFKAELLFPQINADQGAKVFGASAGLQFRIE